jgi:hypothetical protein
LDRPCTGTATDLFGDDPGDGGDGIFLVPGVSAKLLQVSYVGGAGGNSRCGQGDAGCDLCGGGSPEFLAGEARAYTASAFRSDESDWAVEVHGVPGDRAYLPFSTEPR